METPFSSPFPESKTKVEITASKSSDQTLPLEPQSQLKPKTIMSIDGGYPWDAGEV